MRSSSSERPWQCEHAPAAARFVRVVARSGSNRSESRARARSARLLDAAASVFGCWTAALLKRDELVRGRRGTERPFDDILQQQIRLARETGTELAVIVVKPGSVQPLTVRKWVRELRAQLRAVDIAVALPDGRGGYSCRARRSGRRRASWHGSGVSSADEGLARSPPHAGVVSLCRSRRKRCVDVDGRGANGRPASSSRAREEQPERETLERKT